MTGVGNFLRTVAEEADCLILLVSITLLSSINHEYDPLEYLGRPRSSVCSRWHLAGHRKSRRLPDRTHDHPVPDPVWALYGAAVAAFRPGCDRYRARPRYSPVWRIADRARSGAPGFRSGARETRLQRVEIARVAYLGGLRKTTSKALLTGSAGLKSASWARSVCRSPRVLRFTAMATRSRLIETLQAHYPALFGALGEESFEALARRMLRAHDQASLPSDFTAATLDALCSQPSRLCVAAVLAELARFGKLGDERGI